MIDRSQFLEELKRNPDLMHRIAVITAGEVSASAPISKQILQAETIFNRAMARGQTLEQVMREHRFKGDDGYYPPETFVNGEKSLARNGGEARFRELVLKPVMNGSDVGTQTFGYAPTGNASEGTNRFASTRAAKGEYSRYKWHPDGKEMYVQQANAGDRDERIAAKRTGTQPTQLADQLPGGAQPAGYEGVNYATPRQTPEEAANTAMLKRHYGAGYQPPGVVDVTNPAAPNLAQIPLPPQRPGGAGPGAAATATAAAPAAPSIADGLANLTVDEAQRGGGTAPPPDVTPAPAVAAAPPPAKPQSTTTVSARAATPPKPVASLGDRIIQAMGPRGAGRSTYIDPDTGHQILNPGGSGEEGMGITRDLGRLSPPGGAQTRSAARPAPSRVESSPGIRDMAQEPYTRATVPDILAPLNQKRETVPDILAPTVQPEEPFDENWMQRRNAFDRPVTPEPDPQRRTVPDVLAPLTGGDRTAAPDVSSQRRTVPDVLAPQPRPPFDPNIFDPNQITQQRPLGDFKPAAPPAASSIVDLLFGPRSEQWHLPQPPGRPLSIGQQLFGMGFRTVDTEHPAAGSPAVAAAPRGPLAPFEPGARNAPFSSFPLAPDAARLLAAPTSGPAPTLPRSLEDRSVAPAFGGRPSPLPFTPRTTDQQLRGLSPFAELGSRGPVRVASSLEDLNNDRALLKDVPLSYPENYAGSMPGSRGSDPLSGTAMSNRLYGLGNEMRGKLEEDRTQDRIRGLDPTRPRGGVPVLDPFTNKPIGVDEFNQPRGQPIDYRTAPPPQEPTPQVPVRQEMAQANLSPFEQWPPPWWNFAGGDFGGGGGFGGGFGGGVDFGAYG